MPWETKFTIVDQVIDFDSSLSSVSFKTHGCIYFKEDLQRLGGVSETIQLSSGQDYPDLGRYVMGPLTKGEFWISGGVADES
jgi:hypothetical protein